VSALQQRSVQTNTPDHLNARASSGGVRAQARVNKAIFFIGLGETCGLRTIFRQNPRANVSIFPRLTGSLLVRIEAIFGSSDALKETRI
jgi:hypothetical protein